MCGLSADDVVLVRELLVVGGDTDELSRRTGLGPDVVRQRLQAAAAHLGNNRDDAPVAPLSFAPEADDEADFLERLARGVVEADDALRHLP